MLLLAIYTTFFFQLYHDEWDDENEVCFVLDKHTSSLKQQSKGRHVNLLGYVILIPSQPILFLLLNAMCLMEKLQIPILLSLIWLESTIYHTWGEHANHYTTEPTIYHTWGEHANHYTTEPTIYHTWGEHANHYTTEPTIYHTWGEHANPRSTTLEVSMLTIIPFMWLPDFRPPFLRVNLSDFRPPFLWVNLQLFLSSRNVLWALWQMLIRV